MATKSKQRLWHLEYNTEYHTDNFITVAATLSAAKAKFRSFLTKEHTKSYADKIMRGSTICERTTFWLSQSYD